jgi:hypothetical protein
VPQGLKAQQEHKARLVLKVFKALKVRKGQQVQQVHRQQALASLQGLTTAQ